MSNGAHGMTVRTVGENADTAQITVPASVQRDQDISIDDTVEVTVKDLGGLFESITFENNQTAGDRVTVPAEVVRKAGIDTGEEYPVMFEKVEDGAEWDPDIDMEEEGIGVEESDDQEDEEETIADLFSQ